MHAVFDAVLTMTMDDRFQESGIHGHKNGACPDINRVPCGFAIVRLLARQMRAVKDPEERVRLVPPI
jgi:hypothetical protein